MPRTGKMRRRRARKRLKNRLLLVPARGLVFVVSLLSPPAASRLGAALGRLAFSLVPDIRRKTLANLEIAFGDRMSPDRRRRVALEAVRRMAASAVEWASFGRLGPERAAEAVVSTVGMEHFREVYDRGRGLIGVTAHFGLFEMLPVYVIQRGYRGKVVGRRPSDENLEAFVVERRRRMGVETIPQTGAREMLRVLKRGGFVGILPDQDIDKLPGLFLPFFGRDAWTPTGPASLAVTANAQIVPLFLHRVGPGRHCFVVREPIEDPGGDRETRVRVLTERINAALEREIAAQPEQWVWLHGRWETTPEELERKRARRAERQARRMRNRQRGERTVSS